jgi:hypothetical protein
MALRLMPARKIANTSAVSLVNTVDYRIVVVIPYREGLVASAPFLTKYLVIIV